MQLINSIAILIDFIQLVLQLKSSFVEFGWVFGSPESKSNTETVIRQQWDLLWARNTERKINSVSMHKQNKLRNYSSEAQ